MTIAEELKKEAAADKNETGNDYGHACRIIDVKEVKCVLNILGKYVFFVNDKRTAAAKI